MGKRRKSTITIERVFGYIKEEDDEQIVLRIKLPNGRVEERIFDRKALPERQKGVSSILLEIKTTARWLSVSQSNALFASTTRNRRKQTG